MFYGVVFGAAEMLLTGYIWNRCGIWEDKRNKRSLVALAAVGLLAVGMNFLLVLRQYPALQRANLMAVYSILAIAAGIDYKKYEIPNKLVSAGIVVRALLLAAEALTGAGTARQSLVMSVAGLVLGLFFMLFLVFITRHGIGYGDVKLFAWLGFSVGVTDAYYILFYSVLFAAVAGVVLLALKKADRKKKLPFAPFIFAGCYAVFMMSLIQG